MTLRETEAIDLPTPNGPMRTHLFRPSAPGQYPGIVLYSEIFQMTGPIARTAAFLAGHGFLVAVPEIYHEFLPAGTVLAYDQAGADQGNRLKTEKEREEAYEILGGFTQRKPYPSLEGIKNILADLNLPAAKTADPKDFVDTRYLEELDRSGFIDGLYR